MERGCGPCQLKNNTRSTARTKKDSVLHIFLIVSSGQVKRTWPERLDCSVVRCFGGFTVQRFHFPGIYTNVRSRPGPVDAWSDGAEVFARSLHCPIRGPSPCARYQPEGPASPDPVQCREGKGLLYLHPPLISKGHARRCWKISGRT